MHKGKYTGRNGRSGSVLIMTLLVGLAMMACATAGFKIAFDMSLSYLWRADQLRHENIALQSVRILGSWFRDGVADGSLVTEEEFMLGAEAKDDPVLIAPDAPMLRLRENNPAYDVRAEIIDQNYSAAYAASADTLGVTAMGVTEITLAPFSESPDIYTVKRYQIYCRVSRFDSPLKKYTARENYLVLRNVSGDYRIICTYRKKQ